MPTVSAALGCLTDRIPQSPLGREHDERDQGDRGVHDVDQQRLGEQGLPHDRDRGEPGSSMGCRIGGSLRYCLISGSSGIWLSRNAVRPVAKAVSTTPRTTWLTSKRIANHAKHGRHPHPGDDAAQEAHLRAEEEAGRHRGEERRHEELALDGDVDDTRALAQAARQGAQDEGRRLPDRLRQRVGERDREVAGLVAVVPDQEADQERQPDDAVDHAADQPRGTRLAAASATAARRPRSRPPAAARRSTTWRGCPG